MINFTSKDRYDFADLQRLVEVLRAPGGCPWDGAQTHLSIRRNFLEEAYEACEGFDLDDPSRMREELEMCCFRCCFTRTSSAPRVGST